MKISTMFHAPMAGLLLGILTVPNVVQGQNGDGGSLPMMSPSLNDFEDLNLLWKNSLLFLPGTFQFNDRVGIANLDLTMANLVCDSLDLGDLRVDHFPLADGSSMQVEIRVSKLDLNCRLTYDYDYGILSGDGSLVLQTQDNSASSTFLLSVNSNNDALAPEASLTQCVPDIEVIDIDFQGDFVSSIVEFFQRSVREVVEREVGQVLCSELEALGTTLVEPWMKQASDRLEPFLEFSEVPSVQQIQNNLGVFDSFVDFVADDDESLKFGQLLQQVDAYFGQETINGLGINNLLREAALEEGKLVLSPDDMQIDPVLLKAHDRLLETTITLKEAHLVGLDSVTALQKSAAMTNHISQHSWNWDELKLVLNASLEMKPSTLADAILQDSTQTKVVEDISIELSLRNVDIVADLFLAIDQAKFADFSLVNDPTQETFPCVPVVVDQTELVRLQMEYGEIGDPVLSGFVSPGLDQLFTDASLAALDLFEDLIQQSLPGFVQSTARDILNKAVVSPLFASQTNCVEAGQSSPNRPANQGVGVADGFRGSGNGDDDDGSTIWILIGGIIAGVLLGILLVQCFVKHRKRRQHAKWQRNFPGYGLRTLAPEHEGDSKATASAGSADENWKDFPNAEVVVLDDLPPSDAAGYSSALNSKHGVSSSEKESRMSPKQRGGGGTSVSSRRNIPAETARATSISRPAGSVKSHRTNDSLSYSKTSQRNRTFDVSAEGNGEGRLKDDATYATPPGGQMRSQKQTFVPNSEKTPKARNDRYPLSSRLEQYDVESPEDIEEMLTVSEYMEETVIDDDTALFEEVTVQTGDGELEIYDDQSSSWTGSHGRIHR